MTWPAMPPTSASAATTSITTSSADSFAFSNSQPCQLSASGALISHLACWIGARPRLSHRRLFDHNFHLHQASASLPSLGSFSLALEGYYSIHLRGREDSLWAACGLSNQGVRCLRARLT